MVLEKNMYLCNQTITNPNVLMKKILLSIVLLIVVSLNAHADKVEELLDTLDIEVAQYQKYNDLKERELTRLRQNFQIATLTTDKYLSSKQLIEEYLKFNSDSANHYAEICLKYARQTRNKDWEFESNLYIAYIYALHGAVQQARQTIASCGAIDTLPESLQYLYAKVQLEIAIRMRDMVVSEREYRELCGKMWETYQPYVKKDDVLNLYYCAYMNSIDNKVLLKRGMELLKKYNKPYSYEKSQLEMAIFTLLDRMGKGEEAMQYLVRSAITDVRLANREGVALLIVTSVLVQNDLNCKSHLDRELSYIALCAKNVRIYKDFGRSLWLIVCQGQIHESNRKYTAQQIAINHSIIGVLAFLLLLTIGVLCFVWRKLKRRQQNGNLLSQEHQALLQQKDAYEANLQDLQAQVETLKEEIRRRDLSYLDGITLNVNVIKKSRARLQKLQNLAAAKKWSEVYNMLGNELFDDNEYKEISRSLDKIILTVHPNFVEQFNALLKPEARISLENPQKLTPELRIYGLISLGLTDIGSIAEILHYSTQTIYNYRLKIKRAALVPEQELDEAVISIHAGS